MGFREVPVFEVKELFRLWLRGGCAALHRSPGGVDRKTVRRYVVGCRRARRRPGRRGGPAERRGPLRVLERVRPHRTIGHGEPVAHPRGPRQEQIPAGSKTRA